MAKNIRVIGNGDIFDPLQAEKIFKETSCDGILLSRGLMGCPWLIEDIYQYLSLNKWERRLPSFYRESFLEHVRFTCSYRDERKALLDLRRISCWYLKEKKGARKLRETLFRCTSLGEIEKLITEFAWQSESDSE